MYPVGGGSALKDLLSLLLWFPRKMKSTRMARLNNEDISECRDDNNVITRNFATIIIILTTLQVYMVSFFILIHLLPRNPTSLLASLCFKVSSSWRSKLFNLNVL